VLRQTFFSPPLHRRRGALKITMTDTLNGMVHILFEVLLPCCYGLQLTHLWRLFLTCPMIEAFNCDDLVLTLFYTALFMLGFHWCMRLGYHPLVRATGKFLLLSIIIVATASHSFLLLTLLVHPPTGATYLRLIRRFEQWIAHQPRRRV
jgi:hypothetical protein